MKRLLSHGLFVLVCSTMLTASAHAATAHFAGACAPDSTNTHLNCAFDALRGDSMGNPISSCNDGSAPTGYAWDYEDGSNLDFSGSYVGHSYPLPILSGTKGYPYGYFVRLIVYCPEGASPALERYICVYGFGVAGCINPNGAWY